MNNYDKLHSEELYFPGDPEIMEEQNRCLELLYDYNATRPSEPDRRAALLKEMFAEIGEGCYIEPPLRSNFGGHHVHFGKQVYANFNLTLVDDTHIYVGDYTMIGPNVTIATAAIPSFPCCARRACSTTPPSGSAKTAGSAREPFSCPASPSGTTPSSGPEAW